MGLIEDIDAAISSLEERLNPDTRRKLKRLGDRLKELALRRVISSNHTVMELVVAAYLLSRGYEVEVEHALSPSLVCDVYGVKDGRSLIVEVETGFVPPENSLDPVAYRMARELSKVARYSRYADEFAVAVPPFHILQLPYIMFLPPEERVRWGISHFKRLIDSYYSKPPVRFDELLEAKLHYVYIVLVDKLQLIELTAREYYISFLEKPAAILSQAGWPFISPPLIEQAAAVSADPPEEVETEHH
ncbi:MAG: hypothetical protein DRK00_04925 [Thermoprotei archaeon]|nr:MAG: hypothetical protein DRK00_04925 [Thermoprotei archaeon]